MNEFEADDNSFMQTVMNSKVVSVICNGCGSEQVMNAVYAAYVMDGLRTCRVCCEKVGGDSEME